MSPTEQNDNAVFPRHDPAKCNNQLSTDGSAGRFSGMSSILSVIRQASSYRANVGEYNVLLHLRWSACIGGT
jgi:hypothetical protein